jgi:predicted dehydrogenase
MSELMDAIDSGKKPKTNGDDNLKTMAIVEAGYRSLRERRCVPIAEAMEPATVTR